MERHLEARIGVKPLMCDPMDHWHVKGGDAHICEYMTEHKDDATALPLYQYSERLDA